MPKLISCFGVFVDRVPVKHTRADDSESKLVDSQFIPCSCLNCCMDMFIENIFSLYVRYGQN